MVRLPWNRTHLRSFFGALSIEVVPTVTVAREFQRQVTNEAGLLRASNPHKNGYTCLQAPSMVILEKRNNRLHTVEIAYIVVRRISAAPELGQGFGGRTTNVYIICIL